MIAHGLWGEPVSIHVTSMDGLRIDKIGLNCLIWRTYSRLSMPTKTHIRSRTCGLGHGVYINRSNEVESMYKLCLLWWPAILTCGRKLHKSMENTAFGHTTGLSATWPSGTSSPLKTILDWPPKKTKRQVHLIRDWRFPAWCPTLYLHLPSMLGGFSSTHAIL